jgi:hypothetical protein
MKSRVEGVEDPSSGRNKLPVEIYEAEKALQVLGVSRLWENLYGLQVFR